MWVTKMGEAEFGYPNIFFDMKKALQRLKESEVSQDEVKYLYYEIVASRPTTKELKETIIETLYKIKLQEKAK